MEEEEEAEEEEDAEEAEVSEYAETVVDKSKYEEDWVEPWKPLIYSRGGVDVEDGEVS